MTSRIFKSILLMGSIILLTVVSVFVHKLNVNYQNQTFSDMRAEAELVMNGMKLGGIEYLESLSANIHITWFDEDGTVLFDNYDPSTVGKVYFIHEEVSEAMQYGEGMSERRSENLHEQCLYYAVRAEDEQSSESVMKWNWFMLFCLTYPTIWGGLQL